MRISLLFAMLVGLVVAPSISLNAIRKSDKGKRKKKEIQKKVDAFADKVNAYCDKAESEGKKLKSDAKDASESVKEKAKRKAKELRGWFEEKSYDIEDKLKELADADSSEHLSTKQKKAVAASKKKFQQAKSDVENSGWIEKAKQTAKDCGKAVKSGTHKIAKWIEEKTEGEDTK